MAYLYCFNNCWSENTQSTHAQLKYLVVDGYQKINMECLYTDNTSHCCFHFYKCVVEYGSLWGIIVNIVIIVIASFTFGVRSGILGGWVGNGCV